VAEQVKALGEKAIETLVEEGVMQPLLPGVRDEAWLVKLLELASAARGLQDIAKTGMRGGTVVPADSVLSTFNARCWYALFRRTADVRPNSDVSDYNEFLKSCRTMSPRSALRVRTRTRRRPRRTPRKRARRRARRSTRRSTRRRLSGRKELARR
jgi:hypothetical protein